MNNLILLRTICKRWVHNDSIISFIRNNAAISQSTVFQGTLYELTVLRELAEKLGMTSLEKVGGAHDGGVDIKGTWPISNLYKKLEAITHISDELSTIPKRSKVNGRVFRPLIHRINDDILLGKQFAPLKVLVQAKAFRTTKVSPKELRELVGTFSSMVPDTKRNSTIILMCSPHMLTKDSLNLINNVKLPLIYLRIEMLRSLNDGSYDIEKSGTLLNYYENEYASKLLEGLSIQRWLTLKLYDVNQKFEIAVDE
ncbi:Rrg7p NDAI_0E00590 [Naumovozyma dairenensis CBS 421]|uniref:Required for respiratory growth protein 7, mitochondrial n=1 Tax=Naumovozyma dairenensis (strain ATCC 10597 / BCRC 20456 / CBS 421 / NBRC 0211 / NRRL Y-12639) TaxID=1071378 RepID=G0WAV5_NAUDC|nr:hypothetical protein NDAI_0E00590 [Naumovozyma dairenensis CBS 421]CCD24875.1 hypothetical protein NDAI_0E00590 [Naumovozyma dairenensis CBS 421]